MAEPTRPDLQPHRAPKPPPPALYPQVLTEQTRGEHYLSNFGWREAYALQRVLLDSCVKKGVWTVDLTDGVIFNWRALVASMIEEDACLVVGPGIIRVSFRILRGPCGAEPFRHVLEFVQSSGVAYHLHNNPDGTTDRPSIVKASMSSYQ